MQQKCPCIWFVDALNHQFLTTTLLFGTSTLWQVKFTNLYKCLRGTSFIDIHKLILGRNWKGFINCEINRVVDNSEYETVLCVMHKKPPNASDGFLCTPHNYWAGGVKHSGPPIYHTSRPWQLIENETYYNNKVKHFSLLQGIHNKIL